MTKNLCDMTLSEMDQYCKYRMAHGGGHDTCVLHDMHGCALIPLRRRDNLALKTLKLSELERYCTERKANLSRILCYPARVTACPGCFFGKDHLGNHRCILIPLLKNKDAEFTWENEEAVT